MEAPWLCNRISFVFVVYTSVKKMTKIHTWNMKTIWLLNDSDLDGSDRISCKKKDMK